MTEGTYSPGLLVVLEDLEVEEDDEGEGEGDGGDQTVPGATKKEVSNSRLVSSKVGKYL